MPFASILAIGTPHADLLRSARPGPARSPLADLRDTAFSLSAPIATGAKPRDMRLLAASSSLIKSAPPLRSALKPAGLRSTSTIKRLLPD